MVGSQKRCPHRRIPALVAPLLFAFACASPPGQAPGPSHSQGPVAQQGKPYPLELPDVDAGPSIFQRAASAMEGALVGAVVGAQAGPLGAAVGAGTLLVYAAVTGEVPMVGGGDPDPPDSRSEERREREMEEQIQAEEWRKANGPENEIDAELLRQEELLNAIETEQSALRGDQEAPIDTPLTTPVTASAKLRSAPKAPADPDLPRALFETRRVRVAGGIFGNDQEVRVLELSLDADGDGSPEILRLHDLESDELLHREQDSNFDGRIDVWHDYAAGILQSRRIDRDHDGRVDVWEEFAEGWMIHRRVDRNGDGRTNEHYQWSEGSLIVERHDADGNGKLNRLVRYQDRLRVRAEEDLDGDGRMDRITTYAAVEGAEVAVRIEQDRNLDGRMDVVETFAAVIGPPMLLRREEDRDADGEVDVTSIYEEGRLVRREISNPDLVPL